MRAWIVANWRLRSAVFAAWRADVWAARIDRATERFTRWAERARKGNRP